MRGLAQRRHRGRQWQLDDVVPGAASSYPSGFTLSGPFLYFTAEEPLHGRELWAIPASALEALPCTGDCDRNGTVAIDELVTLVNVGLGLREPAACALGDADGDRKITIAEIVAAVSRGLEGCTA